MIDREIETFKIILKVSFKEANTRQMQAEGRSNWDLKNHTNLSSEEVNIGHIHAKGRTAWEIVYKHSLKYFKPLQNQ